MKKIVLERVGDVVRALGSGPRLELLEHVSQGERSVERLADAAGLSVANASQHLLKLRAAGFVRSRRDGKAVMYSLADPSVTELVAGLFRHAERTQAEIRAIVADSFGRLDRLEAVSRSELIGRLEEGAVTLLDVRPEDEFALGHLPGALNVRLDQLEARLAELPADREIVAYCRGPYCVLSFEAVAVLRSKGFTVRRLEDGYPEWLAAGLPTESAERAL
ncbi:ArsR family transcriptional regulator [Methylopila jiangsuensis]|uniref:ArsR family transcriptional regulator n=1 Tax=Methylopila jiangsuensis TaxID=586230 RepID=A0A9W6N575_9HYPH|nr:metalloregulator ArsR/SmtB family transcription factor [Methylopila jiangsuensis]MDR6284496.1 ArsR family transcriptional regulator [Methylopila jiangsuensis]GLK78115.1 ArsR family transcriptional regulator [Methylopila jiangsuensis]